MQVYSNLLLMCYNFAMPIVDVTVESCSCMCLLNRISSLSIVLIAAQGFRERAEPFPTKIEHITIF